MAGRSLTAEAITGTPRSARSAAPRSSPRSRRPAPASARELALEPEHLEDVAGALDMDQRDIAAPGAPAPARRRRTRVSSTSSLRRAVSVRDSLGSRTTGRSRWSGWSPRPPCADRRRAAAAPPPRAARCGTGRGPRRAIRPPVSRAGLAQLDELEAARGGDRVHVGAGIDHRALAGEDAAPGIAGATIARVTPSARLTAIVEVSGLIAGATSIAALNGPVRAWCPSAPSTPRSTSPRPSREKPATIPGVTHLPVASMTLRAGRHATVVPPAHDPAVADHDGAARDRLRPVAERDACRR